MKSKLILGLDGSEDQGAAELLDLLFYDCLNANNMQLQSAARRKAFEMALAFASANPDLWDGTVRDGSWGTKEDGFVYIYRNEAGLSLWYHPQEDVAILQENFFN